MIHELQSDNLKVKVNTTGGSLWSILDEDNTEYIWQGDSSLWSSRAPNLFPYIARLTDGKYTLYGKTYEMDIHGFVKDCELELVEQGESHLRLLLKANETTRVQYPYKFTFEIIYQLKGKCLDIIHKVINLDTKTMYFALGGHPGFNVPLEQVLDFTDYYVEFKRESTPQRIGMSKDCFVIGENVDYPLYDGKIIYLKHDLFDDDAVILKNMPKEVSLRCVKGRKGLKITYPQMMYLGLWHTPKTDAPFLCIEPWTSLPSRKGVVEDLSKQDDLIVLPSGNDYTNILTIEVLS